MRRRHGRRVAKNIDPRPIGLRRPAPPLLGRRRSRAASSLTRYQRFTCANLSFTGCEAEPGAATVAGCSPSDGRRSRRWQQPSPSRSWPRRPGSPGRSCCSHSRSASWTRRARPSRLPTCSTTSSPRPGHCTGTSGRARLRSPELAHRHRARHRRPHRRLHRSPAAAPLPDTVIRRLIGTVVIAIGIRYLWSGLS